MPSRRLIAGCRLAVLGLVSLAPAARGQASLAEAAQQIRAAWMAHDFAALARSSDTIVLKLPGGEEAGSVGREQTVRLLGRYFQPAAERGFDLLTVKETGPTEGYAEAARRYAVRGTSDEVRETVFLGFRLVDRRWKLTEIRVTP